MDKHSQNAMVILRFACYLWYSGFHYLEELELNMLLQSAVPLLAAGGYPDDCHLQSMLNEIWGGPETETECYSS